jgi:hypothetical protein
MRQCVLWHVRLAVAALLLLLLPCPCLASRPVRNGSVVYYQEDAWQSNGTACAAVRTGRLPSVIVQIGPQRTASTLQYATLLLLAQLLCPGAGIKSGFVHRARAMRAVLAEQRDAAVLQVYKTHTWGHIAELPANAWVFVSTYDEKNTSQIASFVKDTYGRGISYIQNMTFVKNTNNIGDLAAYERYFPMDIYPTETLTKALDKWRVLRLCCGSQMASAWRDALVRGTGTDTGTGTGTEGGAHAREAHMCESVDLDGTERALFARLAELRVRPGLLPFGTHAPIAPYVGWCACTVRLTRRLGLRINSHQYQQCERAPRSEHSTDT